MRDEGSLKKSHEFKRVYKYGNSIADRLLVLYVLSRNNKRRRVGYSVSKKIGKAVVRNKVKRRLREIYRHNEDSLKVGMDIVLIARKSIVNASYQQIERSAKKLFKRAKITKD